MIYSTKDEYKGNILAMYWKHRELWINSFLFLWFKTISIQWSFFIQALPPTGFFYLFHFQCSFLTFPVWKVDIWTFLINKKRKKIIWSTASNFDEHHTSFHTFFVFTHIPVHIWRAIMMFHIWIQLSQTASFFLENNHYNRFSFIDKNKNQIHYHFL